MSVLLQLLSESPWFIKCDSIVPQLATSCQLSHWLCWKLAVKVTNSNCLTAEYSNHCKSIPAVKRLNHDCKEMLWWPQRWGPFVNLYFQCHCEFGHWMSGQQGRSTCICGLVIQIDKPIPNLMHIIEKVIERMVLCGLDRGEFLPSNVGSVGKTGLPTSSPHINVLVKNPLPCGIYLGRNIASTCSYIFPLLSIWMMCSAIWQTPVLLSRGFMFFAQI